MSPILPNFVVVGAPKCGTTSLYYYLRQHPQVFLPQRKELHYFAFPFLSRLIAGPGDSSILATSCRTLEEYRNYFTDARDEKAVGDISPSYFHYAEEVAPQIHSTLGEPKIIVMLRDPVQKAFSQYMHLIRDNRETLEFPAALDAEEQRIGQGYSAMWRYAESSLFFRRTQRFIEEFGRERVRVVLFDDLARDPAHTVAGVFEFLGVDPAVPVQLDSTFNRSGAPRSRLLASAITRPNPVTRLARRLLPLSITGKVRDLLQRANTGEKHDLDAASRDRLRQFFAADTAELETLLQRALPWRPSIRGGAEVLPLRPRKA
jgi:hypothetical protein